MATDKEEGNLDAVTHRYCTSRQFGRKIKRAKDIWFHVLQHAEDTYKNNCYQMERSAWHLVPATRTEAAQLSAICTCVQNVTNVKVQVRTCWHQTRRTVGRTGLLIAMGLHGRRPCSLTTTGDWDDICPSICPPDFMRKCSLVTLVFKF
jgi:hypothetical protein